MREINLQIRHTASISFTSADLKSDTYLGSVDFAVSGKAVQIAQSNGGKILYAATDISKSIEDIICAFLFGSPMCPSPQENFFRNEIAQSSNLSFQFKKEILNRIINERNLLQGKEKATIQEHLKSIMGWRNAFAHGNLTYDDKQGTLLRYYAGSNKCTSLDNDFWNSVEYTFSETRRTLEKLLALVKK